LERENNIGNIGACDFAEVEIILECAALIFLKLFFEVQEAMMNNLVDLQTMQDQRSEIEMPRLTECRLICYGRSTAIHP
jgi:hypothetical protein